MNDVLCIKAPKSGMRPPGVSREFGSVRPSLQTLAAEDGYLAPRGNFAGVLYAINSADV